MTATPGSAVPSAPAVLHVLTRLQASQGGSAAAAISIARGTAAAGSPVTVLTTRGAEPAADTAAGWEGLELVACRRHWPGHIGFSLPLLGWLARNIRRFDLVEVHEVWAFPVLAAWAASRRAGVPLVIHPHGSLEPYDLRKHRRAKSLLGPGLRRMLRDAAAVWLTDQREADSLDSLAEQTGVHRVVSPLPVAAPAGTGEPARFRAAHGLGADDRVALFLGRLDPKKGLFRLLRAFETVRRSDPLARLVIAGDGAPRFVAEVHERVARSPFADSIHLIGFVAGQDKLDALSGADLFVLHSDNENFGIAVVEALHCGTPVLLSDQVFVGDRLAAAGAAVVVAVTDEEALATRLGELLADPAARSGLAAHAPAAVAGYVPETVASRDAAIRAELLARARPRRPLRGARGRR